MTENIYVVVFNVNNARTINATDIKDLLNKTYTHLCKHKNNTFIHALNGLTNDKECIDLYNHFIHPDDTIKRIFKISEEIGLDPNERIKIDMFDIKKKGIIAG